MAKMLNASSNLGDVLWRYRIRRGLSYRQAARESGVSSTTLNDVEKNLHDPRWSTVQKILRWMDANPPSRPKRQPEPPY